ncbi:CopD family protein [Rahnella aquatilis]|uniref:CopD family protein n=1 Tax=Rahnella aquatilis TaxID=34038 RepID=UPI0036461D38
MLHEWLNALHVIAGVLWIGGMLAMALCSQTSGAAESAGQRLLLVTVRKWTRSVTSPAMILLWVAGIVMIVSYGKFPHAWLLIKMVIVLVLSALHGLLSGDLRRRATGQPVKDFALVRNAGAVIIVGVILIGILAIIRPF